MINVSKFSHARCDESLNMISALMKDLSTSAKRKRLAKQLKQSELRVKRHYLVRVQEAIKYGW